VREAYTPAVELPSQMWTLVLSYLSWTPMRTDTTAVCTALVAVSRCAKIAGSIKLASDIQKHASLRRIALHDFAALVSWTLVLDGRGRTCMKWKIAGNSVSVLNFAEWALSIITRLESHDSILTHTRGACTTEWTTRIQKSITRYRVNALMARVD
jgi:hypothetical protein